MSKTIRTIFAFLLLLSVIFSCSAGLGDSTVVFGRFEQDADSSNGPEDLEWYVLDREGDRVLLFSKYVLLPVQYTTAENPDATWEDSCLRAWLNNDFLLSAFTEEEQAAILPVTVQSYVFEDNTPTSKTEDRVFALSIEDKKQYSTPPLRKLFAGQATKEALRQGVKTGTFEEPQSEFGCWWLRCDPKEQFSGYYYQFIAGDGATRGTTGDASVGVRPAMWVKLSAIMK